MPAAVKHFLRDTNLLQIFFVGVGMISVYDAGGIFQVSSLCIKLEKQFQILKMVVGNALSMLVYRAS